MDYYIELKLDPDLFNNTPYYFWCIVKNTELSSFNVGHGWSKSILLASQEAYNYFQNSYLSKTN